MDSNPTYQELVKLDTQIRYHADLYFNKDTCEISDYEYDLLVEQFEELLEQHPELAPLFSIQNKPVPLTQPAGQGLAIKKFDTPMLSLKKALDLKALNRYLTSHDPRPEFFYEYKLDGLALELTYENGRLASIFTRGDGLEGEDVTHARTLFKNIPSKLKVSKNFPEQFIVRGEGVIGWKAFNYYNESALKKAATPRNGVSGWVRALPENQNSALLGVLDFRAYWANETLDQTDYSDLRIRLQDMGFSVPPKASYTDCEKNSLHNEFPVDGIVAKVNSFQDQAKLGITNKAPNWAIAYKFPPQAAITSFSKVVWNTSKLGRVVPVIHYNPVTIGMVRCTKASLDNYKQFLLLGLKTDSVIEVTRNGDVIPRVHRVIEQGTGTLIKAPDCCPSCNSVLEVREGRSSAELVCNNVSGCPSQLLGRCIELVNKQTLDIDDLGPVTLTEFIDKGMITRPADIITRPELFVKKIKENILDAKTQPLWRIIKALGLPDIGIVLAKRLALAKPKDMDLLDFLENKTLLQKVPGISAGTILPMLASLQQPAFYENAVMLIDNLTVLEEVEMCFEQKGCVTGELGHAREELVRFFAEQGIELTDKLTKDCQFIVIGEKPGKSKLQKATEMGITMYSASQVSSINQLIQLIKGVKHEPEN